MSCGHPPYAIKRFQVQPENPMRDGNRHEMLWCEKCGALCEMVTRLGQPPARRTWQKPRGHIPAVPRASRRASR